MKKPSISQYLLSTCLFIIDELNEQYGSLSKDELKKIADDKFNEMDITVRLGYPFRQMVHYTVGDKTKRGSKNQKRSRKGSSCIGTEETARKNGSADG